MNILILGSGGREHMLAWKIAQSAHCDKLYIAPGNGGTASTGTNLNIQANDFEAIGKAVTDYDVQLVVVGPEDPLVKGIRDYFESDDHLKHVAIVGPGKNGAQLEGSKDFSKAFMERNGIPAARSKTFTKDTLTAGLQYLETRSMPIVLKADGLAAGKGVIIAKSLYEAKEALEKMLIGEQFGVASTKVLIEDYLEGIELSVFVLCDGTDYVLLPEAKDYKRIGEGDTGLNTGGMGAVSPVAFADNAFMEKVKNKVISPTIKGLKAESIDYKGFIFIGLMNVDGEPYVIEYNVRMGDPETQVVIPRIENDLVELLLAAATGHLSGKTITTSRETAATVVMVAGGYPGSYAKGKEIRGVENTSNALVIHAGTRQENNTLLTNGGRILSVTGRGNTMEEALKKAYAGVNCIGWQDMYYRKDIGKDVLAYQV